MKNKAKDQQKTEIKVRETDIIKGAKKEDQLEKLAPKNDEERNQKEKQTGATPAKRVDDGT
ncbi:hypothetical protein [Pedobacter glucosidilyticus]|uniref:hypothetical protein n=1 Tax=Pedobacter glucosidilyticus TaxID=1122941 RepID=UPI0003FE47C0|nr:hypothetical protein [Pedobacter glucosidilyticus]